MIWSFSTIQMLGALTHHRFWYLLLFDRTYTTNRLIALLNTGTDTIPPQNWWDN